MTAPTCVATSMVQTRCWAAEGPCTPELPPHELCTQFDKVLERLFLSTHYRHFIRALGLAIRSHRLLPFRTKGLCLRDHDVAALCFREAEAKPGFALHVQLPREFAKSEGKIKLNMQIAIS